MPRNNNRQHTDSVGRIRTALDPVVASLNEDLRNHFETLCQLARVGEQTLPILQALEGVLTQAAEEEDQQAKRGDPKKRGATKPESKEVSIAPGAQEILDLVTPILAKQGPLKGRALQKLADPKGKQKSFIYQLRHLAELGLLVRNGEGRTAPYSLP
jgi:hypothetical protein